MRIDTPIQIGKLTLKNRLTMAPTVKFDFTDDTGLATEKHVEHYRERAAAGLGLVCVEAVAVHPSGRFFKNHMGLWEDAQIEGQKKIVDAVHEAGSLIIVQLNHAGYESNPACGPAQGPSAIERKNGTTVAMTIDEIHAMQQCYIDAAVRAKKAGYDGIQLHACHSYMINEFASPVANLRTDEYGGSAENRARFGVEIIKGIRESCGEDFLISARISGTEPTPEETFPVAEAYVAAGCEYLQVSFGCGSGEKFWSPEVTEEEKADPLFPMFPKSPYHRVVKTGIRFKEHFNGRVPVSGVFGILKPEQVHYLIENELLDTVDLARAVLADPAFTTACLDGSDYVSCFDCPGCQYGPNMKHICPAELKRKKTQK